MDADAKMRVERFQSELDNPYKEISGAAALFSLTQFNPDVIQNTITNKHPNSRNIILLVIRGEAMMNLVHALYKKAADEA